MNGRSLLKFRSDVDVELIDFMGTDNAICHAARVSTLGSRMADPDEKKDAGLINFLMRDRHHTPFEMCNMKFRIRVPIFVLNQHVRHRMMSINVESARYTQLEPEFYVPASDRPLVQTGKVGDYKFDMGPADLTHIAKEVIEQQSLEAYLAYESMIDAGIAKEIARAALPMNIYATAYTSFNLRSLMHFLSLRNYTEDSAVPTHPQYEIEMVAREYEEHFKSLFPVTHETFIKNGRAC